MNAAPSPARAEYEEAVRAAMERQRLGQQATPMRGPAGSARSLHAHAQLFSTQGQPDAGTSSPGSMGYAGSLGSMGYAGPASPGAVESPPPYMPGMPQPIGMAELHARLHTAEQVLAAFEQHRKNVQRMMYTQMSRVEHPQVREVISAALAELQRDPKYLILSNNNGVAGTRLPASQSSPSLHRTHTASVTQLPTSNTAFYGTSAARTENHTEPSARNQTGSSATTPAAASAREGLTAEQSYAASEATGWTWPHDSAASAVDARTWTRSACRAIATDVREGVEEESVDPALRALSQQQVVLRAELERYRAAFRNEQHRNRSLEAQLGHERTAWGAERANLRYEWCGRWHTYVPCMPTEGGGMSVCMHLHPDEDVPPRIAHQLPALMGGGRYALNAALGHMAQLQVAASASAGLSRARVDAAAGRLEDTCEKLGARVTRAAGAVQQLSGALGGEDGVGQVGEDLTAAIQAVHTLQQELRDFVSQWPTAEAVASPAAGTVADGGLSPARRTALLTPHSRRPHPCSAAGPSPAAGPFHMNRSPTVTTHAVDAVSGSRPEVGEQQQTPTRPSQQQTREAQGLSASSPPRSTTTTTGSHALQLMLPSHAGPTGPAAGSDGTAPTSPTTSLASHDASPRQPPSTSIHTPVPACASPATTPSPVQAGAAAHASQGVQTSSGGIPECTTTATQSEPAARATCRSTEIQCEMAVAQATAGTQCTQPQATAATQSEPAAEYTTAATQREPLVHVEDLGVQCDPAAHLTAASVQVGTPANQHASSAMQTEPSAHATAATQSELALQATAGIQVGTPAHQHATTGVQCAQEQATAATQCDPAAQATAATQSGPDSLQATIAIQCGTPTSLCTTTGIQCKQPHVAAATQSEPAALATAGIQCGTPTHEHATTAVQATQLLASIGTQADCHHAPRATTATQCDTPDAVATTGTQCEEAEVRAPHSSPGKQHSSTAETGHASGAGPPVVAIDDSPARGISTQDSGGPAPSEIESILRHKGIDAQLEALKAAKRVSRNVADLQSGSSSKVGAAASSVAASDDVTAALNFGPVPAGSSQGATSPLASSPPSTGAAHVGVVYSPGTSPPGAHSTLPPLHPQQAQAQQAHSRGRVQRLSQDGDGSMAAAARRQAPPAYARSRSSGNNEWLQVVAQQGVGGVGDGWAGRSAQPVGGGSGGGGVSGLRLLPAIPDPVGEEDDEVVAVMLAELGVGGLVDMVHHFRSELLEAEFEILELSRQVDALSQQRSSLALGAAERDRQLERLALSECDAFSELATLTAQLGSEREARVRLKSQCDELQRRLAGMSLSLWVPPAGSASAAPTPATTSGGAGTGGGGAAAGAQGAAAGSMGGAAGAGRGRGDSPGPSVGGRSRRGSGS